MTIDEKKFSVVIDLFTESWRLNQFTKKLLQTADAKFQRKISNQVARFDKHFLAAAESLGLEVLDFTGEEFETGLPIIPINLSDFAANENLIVAAMFEPTIKVAGSTKIIKCGVAILGRKVK